MYVYYANYLILLIIFQENETALPPPNHTHTHTPAPTCMPPFRFPRTLYMGARVGIADPLAGVGKADIGADAEAIKKRLSA